MTEAEASNLKEAVEYQIPSDHNFILLAVPERGDEKIALITNLNTKDSLYLLRLAIKAVKKTRHVLGD